MNKSSELKTTQDIVHEVLEKHHFTRNCDNSLYIKVCERINPDVLNKPFWEVLTRRNDYGLPAFETVRRTRQKLQAAYPELAGSSDVEAMRTVNEGIFRDYARGIV